jgi:hypothetical protein
MTRPNLPSDEIHALLDQAVRDSPHTFDGEKRADLLARVLSEFDAHAVEPGARAQRESSGEIDQLESTERSGPIEIPLEAHKGKTLRHGGSWYRQRGAWLAVAAVVLVVVGVGVASLRPAGQDISVSASVTRPAPATTPPGVAIDLDTPLPQLLSGGVVFEPLGISLRGDGLASATELTADQLSMQSTAGPDDVTILVIAVPVGSATLEELVDEARESGSLRVQTALVPVGDDLLTSFGLRITQETAESAECEPGSACVDLGPIALATDRATEVVELTSPDGRRFWWVESAATNFDSALLDATSILSTIEFVEG